MPSDSTFSSWKVLTGQTLINSSYTFRIILCNGGSLSTTSTAAQIVSNEVIGNGYSRPSLTFGTVAYDSGDSRAEIPGTVSGTFTASGGSIQYDAVVLWRGADSVAALTVSSVNTGTDRLTVTSHGRTNGDKCAVTSTTSLPGGISANTLYYIKSIDANTIELYTDSGLTSLVDITSSGSGTIRLRLANGDPARIYTTTTQTINDGSSQTVQYTSWNFA